MVPGVGPPPLYVQTQVVDEPRLEEARISFPGADVSHPPVTTVPDEQVAVTVPRKTG